MARVNIFAALDIAEDVEYARGLLDLLSALPCQLSLQSIDDLSVKASKGPLHLLMALGIPIFVLSAPALMDDSRRQFIAAGNPVLYNPQNRWYYLTRDVKPNELLSQFPDLNRLFEDVMLLHGDQSTDLYNDLEDYLRIGKEPTLSQYLKLPLVMLTGIINLILTLTLSILGFLEPVGYAAGVVLLGLLAFAPDSSLVPSITLLCCFVAGSSLHLIEALDLWPWLGPIWKSPSDMGDIEEDQKCRTQPGHADSACTLDALNSILDEYRLAKSWATINLILCFVLSLGPAAASLWLRGGKEQYFGALSAFGFGLLVPVIRKLQYRKNTSERAVFRGLTREELDWRQRYAGYLSAKPMPLPISIDSRSLPNWTPEEEQALQKWFGVMAVGSTPGAIRSWVPRRDSVFLSYVWMDDPVIGLAEVLADGLNSIEIECFLDKRQGLSRFAPWRSTVARPLQEATHVILLISPRVGEGRMIHAEMRTIIARWYRESLPSVICVVEPDVADSLKHNPSTELHLRFFLICCPKLTFAEARDTTLLARVIKQRRRQGTLRDLQCLVSSVISEERPVSTLVRME